MLPRLLAGILACVFLPLGITFAVLGGDFSRVGGAFLGAGLGMLLLFVALQSRERARRARRTARTSAEVIESRINHGVQLNAKRQLTLTVRLGTGTHTGAFMWLPSTRIGSHIDVEYDPEQPSNFAPLAPPE